MGLLTGNQIVQGDFITESQRNATKANDTGRVPKLESDGHLNALFLKFTKALTTYQPINGATTPQAVMLDDDRTVILGKANDVDIDEFHGFVTGNHSAQTPAIFLNGASYTTSGNSFTLNAGTNRVLYVIFMAGSGTTPTMPTACSWNGNALTNVLSSVSGTSGISVWRYIAGTSASSLAGTLTFSGHTASPIYAEAAAYQHVDQTTPEQVFDTSASVGTTTSLANDVLPTQAYSNIVHGICNTTGNTTTLDSRITQRAAPALSYKYGDGYFSATTNKTITSTYGSTALINNSFAMALKNSTSTAVVVSLEWILPGFTGLTIGAKYYLSNTAGAISTTPGTTTVLLGKALSATELLIVQS